MSDSDSTLIAVPSSALTPPPELPTSVKVFMVISGLLIFISFFSNGSLWYLLQQKQGAARGAAQTSTELALLRSQVENLSNMLEQLRKTVELLQNIQGDLQGELAQLRELHTAHKQQVEHKLQEYQAQLQQQLQRQSQQQQRTRPQAPPAAPRNPVDW